MDRELLGRRLKAAREARGLSLRQIATTTKITVTALEALESGDYSKLPGGIYSRAFIRAYANEVGLDPEESVKDFVTEQSTEERDAARVRIRPAVTADDRAFFERQQRALRALKLGAVLAGLAIITVTAWLAMEYWPQGAASSEAALPAAPVARPPITPPPPADPIPARSEVASAPSAGRERLTVAFEVTGTCWVQVTADGLVVLSRLLQAGERQTVTADRDMVLDVGNAGAFSWTINGQPAQALGREGRPRRVTVTRENAQSFVR